MLDFKDIGNAIFSALDLDALKLYWKPPIQQSHRFNQTAWYVVWLLYLLDAITFNYFYHLLRYKGATSNYILGENYTNETSFFIMEKKIWMWMKRVLIWYIKYNT